MTDIKTFLTTAKIPYYAIWYYINENGKKTPLGEKNNMTLEEINIKSNKNVIKPHARYIKSKDPNKKYEEIPLTDAEKSSLQLVYTLFMKYTDNYFCVDIDEVDVTSMDDFITKYNCDIFKSSPWIKGNTKGIHIYIKIKNMIEFSNQQGVFNAFKGDLIRTNNMWEKIDKQVYNYVDKIEEFEFDDIKHIFTNDFVNNTPKQVVKIKNPLSSLINISVEQKIRFIFDSKKELVDYTYDLVYNLPSQQYYIKECFKYLMTLPEPYYGDTSYEKWVKVGMALRNTADNSLGYLMWMCFSSKSNTFSVDNMHSLLTKWQSFKVDGGLTYKSIIHWCKTDVPEQFNTIRHDSLMYLIDETIYNNQKGAGDYDIAKIVAKYVDDKYVCADVKYNIWYEFRDHHWNVSDSCSSLRNIISNEVRQLYIDKADSIAEQMIELKKKFDSEKTEENKKNNRYPKPDDPKNEEEDEARESCQKLQKVYNKIQEIIQRLGKTNDKKNIMIELRDILKEENFIDRLDNNEFLLCCSNGVVDFKTKTFRDGKPEDMISKCTNVPYITQDKIDPELTKDLIKFIEQIHPYENTRVYFLEHLSSCLIGTQHENPFTNYIGKGGNGKTQIVNLMHLILGDYAYSFPISLLTQKRQSVGSASPEVAALRGVRYASSKEPSTGDTINEGLFKELTGNEAELISRLLFGPLFKFKPQFKIILCSNHFINIKSNDEGTWRRIKVVDFVSKFLKDPDPENELQFKIDHDIDSKMKKWVIPFLSFLIENAFVTEGKISANELVEATTNGYRNKQNRVGQFIQENIVKCDSGRENKLELSRRCNEWFEMNYKFKINNKQLFEILDQSYDSKGNFYYGLKLINSFNDEAKQPKTREECFIEDFDRYFEVTHNSEDFIKSIRISEWAKIRGLKLDTSKTINPILMDKYGLDVKNKEHYKCKKINGSSVICWFGIKERTEPLPEHNLALTNHFISIDGITDFDTEQEYEIVEED